MPRSKFPWLLPVMASLLLSTISPADAAGKADPRLDGDWQLDPAASEDFEAKLAGLAEALRAKQRNRRRAMDARGAPGGPGGYGAADEYGQVPGLIQDLPPETHDELHERLGDAYHPPLRLQIQSRGSEIGMLGDTPPARRYNLEETVTRMDVSGTATLSTSWSGSTLVVSARYTNRLRSEQRYSVDKSGSVLNVTLHLDDPIAGKLQVHSTYRRQPGETSP